MSWFWKHKEKKAIIKQECFDKLPTHHQQEFERVRKVNRIPYTHSHVVGNSDDGFLLSAIVGMETDNVMLGTFAGGNLAGAIVGEIIADEIREDDYVDNIPMDDINNNIVVEDPVDYSNTVDDNIYEDDSSDDFSNDTYSSDDN